MAMVAAVIVGDRGRRPGKIWDPVDDGARPTNAKEASKGLTDPGARAKAIAARSCMTKQRACEQVRLSTVMQLKQKRN